MITATTKLFLYAFTGTLTGLVVDAATSQAPNILSENTMMPMKWAIALGCGTLSIGMWIARTLTKIEDRQAAIEQRLSGIEARPWPCEACPTSRRRMAAATVTTA